MAKRVNSKNTKAEILEAFAELKKEKSALEAEINQLSQESKTTTKTSVNSISKQPEKEVTKFMNLNQTRNKPSMQYTIENLLMVQSGFGGAISELSEKLTSEATKLEEVRQQVTEEIQQLNNLHSLENIEENTLDNLIQQYEQSAKEFETEFSDRQEELQQEIESSKQTWSKEQQEHQRNIKERNEQQDKTRQRDEETYEYDLNLQYNLDIDQYEQNKKNLYKELEEFQQQQEKIWSEREQSISEREKEFAEVKTEVENFKKELESNINNGKENGRNIGTYQAKVKSDLLAKEVEGEKQFYELRIQSLQQTIQNQEQRIKNLSAQLDSTLTQVQDLAVKAIEGASNSRSFQAMKEIVMEQKNQQKKS
ncbi:MAG: hypothetical protein F6K54_25630 [Okeania sp. SIO3B5]|uniref:hypothetical protein n=1 Tax=Okeania sp. SIO3B5 TaxID=2607811 RepID=UPI0013FFBA41|nr:hypothetical protein [Okeania sp. SIO3B5]NEO56159.1 hypothetical protein [Okeania sp. SIO3B5]